MIVDSTASNAIRILKPLCTRMTARAVPILDAMIAAEAERGTPALLVDLSGVRTLPPSGLAALAELASRWHCSSGRLAGRLVFGLCGLTGEDVARLRQCGLAGPLPLHATRAAALAAPEFRRQALAGTRAVLLCGDPGPALAPLTLDRCPALLDILGRPLIDRALDTLADFGLREAIVTAGHHAPRLLAHLRKREGQALFTIAEGRWQGGRWQGQPMGAVRSLRMLHECHGALRGDTLVVEAGGLLPLPYDRLMEHHHCTGADLTIVEAAGPGTARATSPLGAWVVSPRCLDALCDLGTLATLADLLAALPGSGLRLARFRHKGAAYPLSGPRAYFSLLADALDGRIAGLTPSGERLAPRIWVDSGAQLPADLRTDGALHVGARARIDAGAELRGTNFIGSDARIAGKTLLRNAVIWPETRVGDGAIVDTTIASGAWAINHRFAGSQAAARLPLEGLAPLEPQRAAAAPLKLGRAARIA